MATVHRAKERGIAGFERIVALKRLLPHLAEDESFVRSFVREAKLAALLNHANIVQLYELGRVGHQYFISMEYIQGRDIRKILRQARKVTGPPPVEVVVALLLQACDALDYAHTRKDDNGQPLGLIHRDVSPSNLIVNESGHLKVIDFGIAKAAALNLRTQTGRIKGKMAYMAPEAIKGLTLDARSDLFSTGVLAHELLTARPLFASKNDYQTLQRVQNAELIPPSRYNPECPSELDDVVLRALARDRDERWQCAEDMREALVALKVMYKLNTNPRTVADWMKWAFALETPVAQGSGSISFVSGSRSLSAPSATISTSGVGPVPPVEADDEILEIAWENREHAGPVVLDDVPDVSDRAPRAFLSSPATPSRATPAPDGAVGATVDTADEDALMAYMPLPPPTKDRTPTDWAYGTRPPVDDLLPPALEPASSSDGIPLASTELSGRGVTMDSAMHVAASARSTTSAQALAGAVPEPVVPETSRAATQFGAAIVERESTSTKKIVAIVGGIAAAALALVVFTRGGSGAEKAAASTSAATKASGAPAAASNRGQLRFVVEPADATIKIDDYGEHTGSGQKISVRPGRYTVVVEHEGYKSWSTTLDIAANENQTVRVALAPKGSAEASKGGHSRDSHSRRATHSARDDKKHKRHHTRITQNSDEIIDDPDEDRDVPLSVSGSGITTPVTPKIAPNLTPQPAAPAPSGPVLVPPNKVKKLSGDVPELRRLKGEEIPHRVNVKLCINTAGSVTSTALITTVPDRVKHTLSTAMKTWRYRPYKSAGSVRAACFVQSFKVR